MTDKQTNPFAAFDFSGYAPFAAHTPDLDAIADRQRQMLQAVLEVNRAAMEGYQSVMVRQAELMNDAIEGMAHSVQEILAQPQPGEMAARQIEFIRRALDKAYDNFRELTELTNEANAGTFKVFQDHVADTVSAAKAEAQDAAKPKTAAKKTAG